MKNEKELPVKKAKPKKRKVRRNLTGKMKQFCKHYAIHFNATEAYFTVYKVKNRAVARACGSKTLAKTSIQDYIKKLNNEAGETLKISKLKIIQEFAALAFSDISSYFEDWKTIKGLDTLSKEQRAAILETQTTVTKYGDSFKFKLHDKPRALIELVKLLGYDSPVRLDFEITDTKQVFIINGQEIEF